MYPFVCWTKNFTESVLFLCYLLPMKENGANRTFTLLSSWRHDVLFSQMVRDHSSFQVIFQPRQHFFQNGQQSFPVYNQFMY